MPVQAPSVTSTDLRKAPGGAPPAGADPDGPAVPGGPVRRGRFRRSSGPLGLGVATLWLSIIVLLPLAAIAVKSMEGGLDGFWAAITSRNALASLRVTVTISVIV